MNAQPYSKVTVIVETGDVVETYVIPKAESVVLEHNAIPLSGIFAPPDHPMYLRKVMGINFGLVANFDDEMQCVYKMERTEVAKEVVKSDEELHNFCRHPDYEYETTQGPRKSWTDEDMEPDGPRWERNVDRGRNGWERFDYHEESYWRRKKS